MHLLLFFPSPYSFSILGSKIRDTIEQENTLLVLFNLSPTTTGRAWIKLGMVSVVKEGMVRPFLATSSHTLSPTELFNQGFEEGIEKLQVLENLSIIC